jgi:hypothetical protein
MLALVAAATPAMAQQLSMSSRKFTPSGEGEKALAAQATSQVLPADVRRDPSKHGDQLVFWTGVTDGLVDGTPFVEHHYFDGVVEGHGGVWLSPWGEGRFCLLDVPADAASAFDTEKPQFVRAYGFPVITDNGVCLQRAKIVVGDRGYSTTMIAYGPDGESDFSRDDVELRGATRSYPEERLLSRLGYRVLASVHGQKANDSDGRSGWSASLELDLRLDLRKELALLVGPHSASGFGAPESIQAALLFRYYVVGVGAAFGPLVHIPVRGNDDDQVWFGARYMPTVGDALGRWGMSPAVGGALDVAFTRDGDRRVLLQFTIGLDGNFARLPI